MLTKGFTPKTYESLTLSSQVSLQPLTNLSWATFYIDLESLHGGDKCHSIGYIQGLTRLTSRHMATDLGTKATLALAYLETYIGGHMSHSLGHKSLYGSQTLSI